MEKQKYVQWFCGFYEGEGSISNDKSNNNRLRLSVSQNDITPLELGQKLWGGTIRKRVRLSPASGKVCRGHEWRLSHHESLVFLEDIKPHMLIPYKKTQVEQALKLAEEGLQRRFKCQICDSDFASPSGRRRHFKSVHENTDASGESCKTIKLRETP